MIRGVIFDLDNCILDTRSLTGPFFEPVLDALRSSNLPSELKKKVEEQLWTTSLDDTVDLFAVPEETAEKMREAYRRIEVPDGIRTYGDEGCLRELVVRKILVTSGYRHFQGSKIAKLGIAKLFDSIVIDAPDDRHVRKGKREIFRDILEQNGWSANEALAVGDNPLSELGAAKALGIGAVQILRPTIERWEEADYHIYSLCELKALIATEGRS